MFIETNIFIVYSIIKTTTTAWPVIKNSIKFTASGSINFGYINDKEIIHFFVTDTGLGIEKSKQKIIFERFIQADVSDKRPYQGSGLGLSISKAYVELLGGKIGVESKFGEGSKFYFTLPFIKRL